MIEIQNLTLVDLVNKIKKKIYRQKKLLNILLKEVKNQKN